MLVPCSAFTVTNLSEVAQPIMSTPYSIVAIDHLKSVQTLSVTAVLPDGCRMVTVVGHAVTGQTLCLWDLTWTCDVVLKEMTGHASSVPAVIVLLVCRLAVNSKQ